jgi:hypothetical protein
LINIRDNSDLIRPMNQIDNWRIGDNERKDGGMPRWMEMG